MFSSILLLIVQISQICIDCEALWCARTKNATHLFPASLPFNINIFLYWSTTNKFSFKKHSLTFGKKGIKISKRRSNIIISFCLSFTSSSLWLLALRFEIFFFLLFFRSSLTKKNWNRMEMTNESTNIKINLITESQHTHKASWAP